jgi:hypothetical protein
MIEDKSVDIKSNDGKTQVVGEYLDPLKPALGVTIKVEPDTAVAIQFPGLRGTEVVKGSINPFCAVVNNTGKENIFIPSNSQEEFQSFLNAASSTSFNGDNFNARSCIGRYQTYNEKVNLAAGTANQNPNESVTWIGQLRCSELATNEKPACNQVKIITAQRNCFLENESIGGCEYCSGSDDPDAALIQSLYNTPDTMFLSNQSSKCFFQVACTAVNSPGCPSVPSGGHVFCLAPDTKITMADGTEKEIKDIQAAEEVMAFDAKHSKKGKLKKAKVVGTTITEDQEVIKINDLEITPKHKIVLSSGRGVKASEIRVGDKILKEHGKVEIVNKIDKNRPKIKVYNLILEKTSDGYIANGIRVLSYPMVKGLDKTPKAAE